MLLTRQTSAHAELGVGVASVGDESYLCRWCKLSLAISVIVIINIISFIKKQNKKNNKKRTINIYLMKAD